MKLNIKPRWDIYVHGTDGVKHLLAGLLTMWRHLPTECGAFGKALVELLRATVVVAWVLIGPFMFWLAPLIAIFTAHRTVPDEEMRARLRRQMHQCAPTATEQKE